MRFCHALAFGVLLAAVPVAGAAQGSASAQAEEQVVAAGAWLERANTAMIKGAEGFQALSARMQSLTAGGLTREKAAAAAPELKRLIASARADVQQSNLMLAALPAFPVQEAMPFPAERIVSDARAQNARFLTLLNDNDLFVTAMVKGDTAAMGRVLPRILEGAFSMLQHQRLVLRSRQATYPATDSTHQSLGIAMELYGAMDVVGRRAIAAKVGGAGGASAAAAAMGPELAKSGRTIRDITATGRKNLAVELAELAQAKGGASAADRPLLERVERLVESEEQVFALGDRLASLLEKHKAITGPELAEHGMTTLYAGLTAIEADLVDLNGMQARMLAEPAH